MNERKHYLDNIRWITLCVVILYHVFYIFNSSGVISNINAPGIKAFDSICVFTYPWIMCLLFVVSGVSARYSLNNRTNKEFIKDRAKRILIPSIVGIFTYGWISGWMTNYYTDIFAGNGEMIPVFIIGGGLSCRQQILRRFNIFFSKHGKPAPGLKKAPPGQGGALCFGAGERETYSASFCFSRYSS